MEKLIDYMTIDPVCCTPQNTLQEAAYMMTEYDCGEIPVVDSLQNRKIVGVITDRDICCRTVGKGLNPLNMTVQEIMTYPAVTVTEDTDLKRCVELMEKKQIRRIPIIDGELRVIGIISQADIARKENAIVPELLKGVSQPKDSSAQMQ
jgi:CBS domain-containing protein